MNLSLRPARPEDQAFLFELYASTRAEEMAAWGLDASQQELFLKLQFTAQQQSYQAQFPESTHQIICLEGQPVGRLIVNRTQNEIRLVDIALLPPNRNRGLGTQLIENLLAEAKAAGKPVRLHVLAGSPALALYRRLGFSIIQETPPYLQLEANPQ
jgi:ribosomal protein S18 acetylase RimI-like enzyme